MIQLCTSKANTSRVESGIASPMHDNTSSVGVDCEKVAMSPDTRKHVEVGVEVLFSGGVSPEKYGHTWKRSNTYKLALLTKHRLAQRIVAENFHSEVARLDFTTKNGQHWIGTHETRNNISATRDASKHHI